VEAQDRREKNDGLPHRVVGPPVHEDGCHQIAYAYLLRVGHVVVIAPRLLPGVVRLQQQKGKEGEEQQGGYLFFDALTSSMT